MDTNWNFTECKAFHSVGERKGKLYYRFYIVDYDITNDDKSHIIEMRNKGLAKTKYFHTKKEAIKFLNEICKL